MKSHGTFRWWLLLETLVEHSQWRVQWHRTNHTSPDWTAAVLGWSAVHRSQIPGSPGVSQGMVGSQEVAGLVGLQTLLYWVPDLWALGSLGTRRTCSHLNIFLNYLCFILTFLWNSYSLTPWFFADSRISRQRLAESFVGHGRDCGWEQSVVERMLLLADIKPIILYHFQWLSEENIILSTYWVKWQEVTRTFSRSLSWLRITGSGWVDLTLSCYYQHDTFMPSR